MPVLVGAAMIAAAILLSTLITAVGSRFIGMDSPNDDNMWLIDRMTGNVYKCQAADRGNGALHGCCDGCHIRNVQLQCVCAAGCQGRERA